MNRVKKTKRMFRSMLEIEKEFFPKSFKNRMLEKPTDAHALGIYLARESLDKIRQQIGK